MQAAAVFSISSKRTAVCWMQSGAVAEVLIPEASAALLLLKEEDNLGLFSPVHVLLVEPLVWDPVLQAFECAGMIPLATSTPIAEKE